MMTTRAAFACAIVAVAAASLQGSVRRVNYDESKVGEYRLEDPLVRLDGSRLANAADWPARRREILSVLEREEYGRWPQDPETLVIDRIEEGRSSLFWTAHRQQFAMYFRADRSGPRIDWMLLTPEHAKGPVPVIVILNSHGNHELLTDEEVHVHDAWMPKRYAKDKDADPHRASAKTRGAVRWPLDMVLARGYAVLTACFQQGAADPDADEMPVEEVRRSGCYPLWPDSDDIGTLIVWGWQLSRGLDLAERLPEVDAKRSVAFGCSRLAKAALLAGAFDERFAAVAACQSGGGGAPLWKRQFGENVDWMDQEFRHWYRRGFMKYVSNEQAMPFDQHFLLAAIAPRHLLVEGFDEPWFDAKGEYLACRAASPAWEFLGKPGLPAGGFPETYSEAAIGSHLGYAHRGGSHGISGYDWKWLLDFADRAFGSDEPLAATSRASYESWWWERLLENRRKIADVKGEVDLAFIGDSITYRWQTDGKESLAELRKTYSVLDLGYGGDKTENLLWRCENGELDGYRAKCVMLLIGTNNTWHRMDRPADIAAGIRKILAAVAKKQPQAKILLLPILPFGDRADHPNRVNNEKVNGIIRDFADGEKIVWVDFREKFLDEKGDTIKWMPDRCHPNAAAYREIVLPAVLPHFRAIVGK